MTRAYPTTVGGRNVGVLRLLQPPDQLILLRDPGGHANGSSGRRDGRHVRDTLDTRPEALDQQIADLQALPWSVAGLQEHAITADPALCPPE